jgi:hypothetical protein
MSKLYRTREGTVSASDNKTALTTLGSETAPGPLLVPSGASKLIGIIAAQCFNMGAATGYTALVRLEGNGLPEGPECVTIGAGGVPVATGGNGVNKAIFIPLDIPVVVANEIQVFGEMAGTDVGSSEFAVTLVFAQ